MNAHIAPLPACTLMALASVTSCGGRDFPGSSLFGDGRHDCRNDCEQNIWPRVIVGLVPTSDDIAVTGVEVYVRDDGEERAADEEFCPAELPGSIICSFAAGAGATGPRYTDVWVVGPDWRCDERRVPLTPYNSCGRDITYLVVELHSTGGEMQCTYREPTFVSPCEMEWME